MPCFPAVEVLLTTTYERSNLSFHPTSILLFQTNIQVSILEIFPCGSLKMSWRSLAVLFDRFVTANLVLIAIFPLAVYAQLDARLCYYTYNYIQPDYRPCYPPSAKAVSHCCGVGSTCLGDTLCLSSDGPMYIGSCTMKDWWNSTTIPIDCPKYYEFCKGTLKVLSWRFALVSLISRLESVYMLTLTARQYWR